MRSARLGESPMRDGIGSTAGAAPPRLLSRVEQALVSCFWLANSVHWGALLAVVLPSQVAFIVGGGRKELYNGLVAALKRSSRQRRGSRAGRAGAKCSGQPRRAPFESSARRSTPSRRPCARRSRRRSPSISRSITSSRPGRLRNRCISNKSRLIVWRGQYNPCTTPCPVWSWRRRIQKVTANATAIASTAAMIPTTCGGQIDTTAAPTSISGSPASNARNRTKRSARIFIAPF